MSEDRKEKYELAKRTLAMLNELIIANKLPPQLLVEPVIPVTSEFADNSAVICGSDGSGDKWHVSMLGLVNTILHSNGSPRICLVYDVAGEADYLRIHYADTPALPESEKEMPACSQQKP